jgi:hypothetical protein
MFEKRLTAKAQRARRRNIFIAFAETPKAINLQPFRQLVSLAPESQVPDRAECFSLLCALRVSSAAGGE